MGAAAPVRKRLACLPASCLPAKSGLPAVSTLGYEQSAIFLTLPRSPPAATERDYDSFYRQHFSHVRGSDSEEEQEQQQQQHAAAVEGEEPGDGSQGGSGSQPRRREKRRQRKSGADGKKAAASTG